MVMTRGRDNVVVLTRGRDNVVVLTKGRDNVVVMTKGRDNVVVMTIDQGKGQFRERRLIPDRSKRVNCFKSRKVLRWRKRPDSNPKLIATPTLPLSSFRPENAM